MSDFDGDVEEMLVPPLDDRALEALLGGVTSPRSDFDWLVPFVEELGAVVSRSAPVLQPALATLLADGFSTDKGDLPATAASNVTGPAPQAAGLPKWRKKKMTELFAGLLAKLAAGALGLRLCDRVNEFGELPCAWAFGEIPSARGDDGS